ncbi:hypothetical protein OM076_04725 [Solirubrobacter ginsenosidimutans]|uniref:SDR family oxidoreductase n=1 Tax=Solirubrobacter ginsenosidimutans TaxID=490573 RepID=A0A9X3MN58_9ACTN|nr:hypothetical protein [Solirubrobacter ginsenosidimutans]MDA0159559.1 hypothetical protein [Solirubrobacter ginsenosidimutans]
MRPTPPPRRSALPDESARLYGLDTPEAFAVQEPLERMLEPREVAAMIAWLAGPPGSDVTGAALAGRRGLSV